jgi:hypothetical protein
MKPTNNVIEIKGSLGGEITRMELDQNALVHLMSVLTNLYSDTELAVIREYSTNALDSHIFAGQDRPIEVQTPNKFTNEFIVKDFGLGLSKSEIQNVYGNYGASTKRDSDDVAGCLGLGSKSALAYTSAFTVIGVKDGMQTTALISLGEDGAGRIEVVDETETDEPNGVTVRVPSAYHSDFKDEVRKFFSFWDKGTVLIDGEEPTHFTENMTQLDETVWVSKPGMYGTAITVVMGGVSYEVKDNNLARTLNGRNVVVMADMGTVDFVPSREALNMTQRTKEFLKELTEFVAREIDRILQEKIDATTSRKEVIELAQQRLARNKRDSIIWNNIEHDLIINEDFILYDVDERRSSKGKRGQGGFFVGNVYQGKAAMMINKPFTILSALQRDKIEKHLEDKGVDIRRIYYLRSGKAPFMTLDAEIIDFNEIVKIKVGKREAGSGKPDATKLDWHHYGWDAATNRLTSQTGLVDPKKTVVYLSGANADRYGAQQILQHLKDPNVVIVTFYANREVTFLRGYPKAMTVHAFATKLAEEAEAKISDSDWMAAAVNRYDMEFLVGRTNDPKIDEIWAIVKSGSAKIEAYNRLLSTIGLRYRVHDKVASMTDYVAENYPLVDRYKGQESIEYVNVMYAARNGKDAS